MPTSPEIRVPKINVPLMGGFRWFNRRYLKKHFHTIAVHREGLLHTDFSVDDALVVYANHASWWDPLSALFMCEQVFPGFRLYAPIDAMAYEKYRMFGQMGFFPVDQHSLQGAASFLKISRQLLRSSGASIWITPEGRFVDVRDTEAPLMPGLAHLASSLAEGRGAKRPLETDAAGVRPRVWFIPAALEYTFWEERLPEMLIWLGEPMCVTENVDQRWTKSEWDRKLFQALRNAQSELARAAVARDPDRFEVMLCNRSGTFFVYDWWRRLRGFLKGVRASTDHGEKFNDRKD